MVCMGAPPGSRWVDGAVGGGTAPALTMLYVLLFSACLRLPGAGEPVVVVGNLVGVGCGVDGGRGGQGRSSRSWA